MLDRGYTVRSISRKAYPELEALGVECVQGDLRNSGDVMAALNAARCPVSQISGIRNTKDQIIRCIRISKAGIAASDFQ